jgi:hypothetical protein
MIIIDSKEEIQNFFKKIENFELALVRLDIATFELAQGIKDELVLMHESEYKGLAPAQKAKLDEHRGLVLFGPEKLITENLFYSFDASSDAQLVHQHLVQLENVFKENIILKSQLFSMNKEISGLMGSVEMELLRVKKFYENNTPKRYKGIKSLRILSKYAAGESIGGEFFDIFEDQSKLYLLMSDTSSYLASSSILSLFTAYKLEKNITKESQHKLLVEIQNEMKELSLNKKKELKVSILSLSIDLNSYEVEGYVAGGFRGISSLKLDKLNGNEKNLIHSNISELAFNFNLVRGERVLFLSPGLSRSWSQLKPDFMIEELINKSNIKQLDILDEIFFQLKKDRQSGFLPHDASAIMMEVQKNAIIKV